MIKRPSSAGCVPFEDALDHSCLMLLSPRPPLGGAFRLCGRACVFTPDGQLAAILSTQLPAWGIAPTAFRVLRVHPRIASGGRFRVPPRPSADCFWRRFRVLRVIPRIITSPGASRRTRVQTGMP